MCISVLLRSLSYSFGLFTFYMYMLFNNNAGPQVRSHKPQCRWLNIFLKGLRLEDVINNIITVLK